MSNLLLSMIVTLKDQASPGLKAITSSVNSAGKAIEYLASNGPKFQKWGQDLKTARQNVDDFTNRANAAVQSILKPAVEVDDAMSELVADVGPDFDDLDESMKTIRESAIAWSTSHKQSAQEYITTTDLMIRSGVKEADALKSTEVALRVSTGARADAAGATKTLAILYKQLGDTSVDTATEMSRLGDQLVRAKQMFPQLDVAALSDPLKDAIPAAKAAKVPVEQLIAVLGHFNAAGLQGGDGGAKFGAILQSIDGASKQLGFTVKKTADGGVDLVNTLVGLEDQIGDMKNMTPQMTAKLQAAFGPEAAKAVMLLLGNTKDLRSELGQLTTSTGTATDAQKALEQSTSAQWQIAQKQMDAVKLTLAAGVVPALQAVLPVAKDVVGWFGGFAKEHPSLVAIVGTVLVLAVAAGSVIGPLLSIGGAMTSLLGTLGTAIAETGLYASITEVGLLPALGAATAEAWAFAAAMLANPITWVVLAIIALAAVIYTYWEPISKFFVDLWGKLKDGFSAAWNGVKAVWAAVTGFFTNAFAEIKGAFQVSFIGGVMTVLKYLSPITYIRMAFGAIYPWLQGLWGRIVTGVSDGLSSIWGEVKAGFSKGVIDGLMVLFKRFTPVGWMLTGWNALTQWLFGLSLLDVGKKIISTLWSGIVGGFNFLVGIQQKINGVIADVFGFFLPGLKNDLAGVMNLLGGFNPLAPFRAAWGAVTGFVGGIWTEITSSFDQGIGTGLATVFKRFTPLGWIMTGWNALTKWLFGISLADVGLKIVVSIGDGIRGGFGLVIGVIVSTKDRAIASVIAMWTGITSEARSGIDSVVSTLQSFNPLTLITQGFNDAKTWLQNFSLADAGANIVNTIVDGMKSAANAPVEAMQNVVQNVRNLLPFSPAKAGPLRDLHRVKLVETVASSVNPDPLVNAMTNVAGDAMGAITGAKSPLIAPITAPTIPAFTPATIPNIPTAPIPSPAVTASANAFAPQSGGAPSGPAPVIQLHVNAAETGGDAVAALEAWLANPSNAKRIVDMAARVTKDEQRKGFADK